MTTTLLLTLLGLGCSSYDMKGGGDSASDSGSGSTTETDTDTGIDDEATWSLEATIDIKKGLVVAGNITSIVMDGDGGELCSWVEKDFSQTTTLSAPDPAIFRWWGQPLQSNCHGLPSEIQLGVGQMHPELIARFDSMGLADEARNTLSGAYLSQDGGQTLWVFGFAGDADAYAGLKGPALKTADVEGVWTLTPAFVFPLP